MPELIRHRAHPDHPLDLLPVPAYPDGCFDCDACGGSGTGFSYHCGDCGPDVHPLCVSAPASVIITATPTPSPSPSPSRLTTSWASPATCAAARGVRAVLAAWLYRCAGCEFDVHTSCATGKGRDQQTQVVENQRAQILLGRGRGAGGVGAVLGAGDGLWNRFLGVGSIADISAGWGRSWPGHSPY